MSTTVAGSNPISWWKVYCRHVIARRPGDGLGRAERGDDGDAAGRHPPLLMAVCCRRRRGALHQHAVDPAIKFKPH